MAAAHEEVPSTPTPPNSAIPPRYYEYSFAERSSGNATCSSSDRPHSLPAPAHEGHLHTVLCTPERRSPAGAGAPSAAAARSTSQCGTACARWNSLSTAGGQGLKERRSGAVSHRIRTACSRANSAGRSAPRLLLPQERSVTKQRRRASARAVGESAADGDETFRELEQTPATARHVNLIDLAERLGPSEAGPDLVPPGPPGPDQAALAPPSCSSSSSGRGGSSSGGDGTFVVGSAGFASGSEGSGAVAAAAAPRRIGVSPSGASETHVLGLDFVKALSPSQQQGAVGTGPGVRSLRPDPDKPKSVSFKARLSEVDDSGTKSARGRARFVDFDDDPLPPGLADLNPDQLLRLFSARSKSGVQGFENSIEKVQEGDLDEVMKRVLSRTYTHTLATDAVQALPGVPEGEELQGPSSSRQLGTEMPPLQRFAARITTDVDFETVILLLIIVNCVSMALYNPLIPDNQGINHATYWLDNALNIVFTVEIILKMLSGDTIGQYFTDTWNSFDFVLVAVGYTSYMPFGESTGAIKALRALRALRPLRTINRFGNVRAIVTAFIDALPMIGSVFLLTFFALLAFALICLQTLAPMYYSVCRNDATGELEDDPFEQFACGSGRTCPRGFSCVTLDEGVNVDNPGMENLGVVMLSMFQCVTMSAWSYMQYRGSDLEGVWFSLVFVLLVLFVALIMMNLFTAVLKLKLAKAMGRERASGDSAGQSAASNEPAREGSLNAMLRLTREGLGEPPNKTSTAGSSASNGSDAGNFHQLRRYARSSRLRISEVPARPASPEQRPAPDQDPFGVAAGPNVFVRGYLAIHALFKARFGDTGKLPKSKSRLSTTFSRVRFHLVVFVDGPIFNNFFLLAIVANTVCLAFETNTMSDSRAAALDTANQFFTWLFAVEFGVKLFALGAIPYFSSLSNTFDAVVVLISVVETLSMQGGSGVSALRSLKTFRVLKSLRVLRVVRAFRYLRALSLLAEVLSDSVAAFSAIGMLMVLFLTVFAIIGLQVFGNVELDIGYPNFRSFWNSLVIVFQVMTTEDWQSVMMSTVRATNWGASLFFVVWIILSKYVFLMLFLAVVMEAFEHTYAMDSSSALPAVLPETVVAPEDGKAPAENEWPRGSRKRVPSPQDPQRATADDAPGASHEGLNWHVSSPRLSAVLLLDASTGAALASRADGADAAAAKVARPPNVPRLDLSGVRAWQEGPVAEAQDGLSVMFVPNALALPRDPASSSSSSDSLSSAWISAEAALGERWRGGTAPEPARRGGGPLGEAAAGGESEVDEAGGRDGLRPMTPFEAASGASPLESHAFRPATLRARADPTRATPDAESAAERQTLGEEAMEAFRFTPGLLAQRDEFGGVAAMTSAHGPGTPARTSPELRSTMSSASPSGNVAAGERRPKVGFAMHDPDDDDAEDDHARSPQAEPSDVKPAEPARSLAEVSAAAVASAEPSRQSEDLPPPLAEERTYESVNSDQVTVYWRMRQDVAGALSPPLASFTVTPALQPSVPSAGLPRRHEAAPPAEPSMARNAQMLKIQSRRFKKLAVTDCVDAAAESSGTRKLPVAPATSTPEPERPAPAEVAVETAAPLPPASACEESSGTSSEDVIKASGTEPAMRAADAAPQHRTQRPGPEHAAESNGLGFRRTGTWDDGRAGSGAHPAADPGASLEDLVADVGRTVLANITQQQLFEARTPMASKNGLSKSGVSKTGVSKSGGDSVAKWKGASRRVNLFNRLLNGADASRVGPERKGASRAGGKSAASPSQCGSEGSDEWEQTQASYKAIVDAQVSRMVEVLKHPVIMEKLNKSPTARYQMTRVITRVMVDNLQLAAAEMQDNAKLKPRELDKLKDQLELITLQQWGDLDKIAQKTGADMSDGTKSFMVFSRTHPIRRAAYAIAHNSVFDYTALAFVLISCAVLAIEDPHRIERRTVYSVIELVSLVFFLFEALVKMTADTFTAYIRKATNVLDVVVIVNTILTLAINPEAVNLQALKILRAFRVIRLARVISRSKSMLNVVQSISLSLKEMGNVVLVVILVVSMFGILGVQLFSGKLMYCNDDAVDSRTECVGEFVNEDGAVAQREWLNQQYTFDNLGSAMISLFITLTLDGYLEIMYPAMSIRGDGEKQPRINANPYAFLYFFAYIIVCVFVLMQMFIGIIFYHYTMVKERREGKDQLDMQQRQWISLATTVFRKRPPAVLFEPESAARARLYRFFCDARVDNTINLVIVLNVVILAATWFPVNDAWVQTKEFLNLGFNVFYVSEVIGKMIAFGPRAYLVPNWNKLDAALAVLGIFDFVVFLIPTATLRILRVLRLRRVLRLLRLFRLVRLFRSITSVIQLLMVLQRSLQGIWNVGTVVIFVFYIYAYLGVVFLGKVKPGPFLNEHANFETFPHAASLLFRIATADEWTGIMTDASVRPPHCEPRLDCGSPWAMVYIMSFAILIGQIVLNLFITIVIETYEEMDEITKWDVNHGVLDTFDGLWSVIADKHGTVAWGELLWMLRHLPPPVGLGAGATLNECKAYSKKLVLQRDKHGRLPYLSTLYELLRRPLETELPSGVLVVEEFEIRTRIFVHHHMRLEDDSLTKTLAGAMAIDETDDVAENLAREFSTSLLGGHSSAPKHMSGFTVVHMGPARGGSNAAHMHTSLTKAPTLQSRDQVDLGSFARVDEEPSNEGHVNGSGRVSGAGSRVAAPVGPGGMGADDSPAAPAHDLNMARLQALLPAISLEAQLAQSRASVLRARTMDEGADDDVPLNADGSLRSSGRGMLRSLRKSIARSRRGSQDRPRVADGPGRTRHGSAVVLTADDRRTIAEHVRIELEKAELELL